MNKAQLLGLSRQERELISSFSANEKIIVNAKDVIEIRNCSRETANQILNRLTLKGWLQRIKRGVYSIVPISSLSVTPMVEESWSLVTKVFEPAYISGWSAAEHWDLTEQIFNNVSLVTQKLQRKSIQKVGGIKCRVWVKKPDHFFGLQAIWFRSNKVEIADPSRLLIDILDKPDFGGGGRHTLDVVQEYWKSEKSNAEQLLEYAIRYKKGTVMKRLGFLAEQFGAPVSEKWLDQCRRLQSAGISSLDPSSPKKGKISSRWNLQINIPF